MKKSIPIIIATVASVLFMSVPVCAVNIDFSVSQNDRFSYTATKDDGVKKFYLNLSTYSGSIVRARSKCVTVSEDSYYSTVIPILGQSKAYPYGGDDGKAVTVHAGYSYELETYGSPASWYMKGRYCP